MVFESRKSEAAIKATLEKRLEAYAGKPVGVLVRTAAEMAQVLADNPFPKLAPNRTMAVFLDRAPSADTLAGTRGQQDEVIRLGAPRNLHPLRPGHGLIEAGHCRRQIRHRAQHEHGGDARADGCRTLTLNGGDAAASTAPVHGLAITPPVIGIGTPVVAG